MLVLLASAASGFGDEIKSSNAWNAKESQWHGYARYDFDFNGTAAYVVEPRAVANGKPWVWRARFPQFHADADRLLLERGFHIAYLKTDGMLGSPAAMKKWDQFYDFMVKRGLADRPVLEGVSRGGLFVYGFASRWPDRVTCIYADTPVCDFKSWPLGQGAGIGHEPTWQRLLEEYRFSPEQAMAYQGQPIDRLQPLAAAKIPLLHIVSLNDRVVPPSENTFVLAERYRKLGGEIEIIEVREGTERSNGHHFTHPNPKRAADFIEQKWKARGESSNVDAD